MAIELGDYLKEEPLPPFSGDFACFQSTDGLRFRMLADDTPGELYDPAELRNGSLEGRITLRDRLLELTGLRLRMVNLVNLEATPFDSLLNLAQAIAEGEVRSSIHPLLRVRVNSPYDNTHLPPILPLIPQPSKIN